MPARFILSFDCEGKWGSADGLTAGHRRDLTDRKLRDAYRSILALLDQYQVPATFAFAGAFSKSRERFAELRPEIEALALRFPAYLAPALRDIDETGGDGWHGADLVEAVNAAPTAHEIALHGVTHIPWTQMDAAAVAAELQLFERLEGPVRHSRTFVYPRNLVAHQDQLAAQNFAGYREARHHGSRLVSLLSEFNLFERPEAPHPTASIIRIPAGFFLNWRSGLRTLVPPAITRFRAKLLLDRAAKSDAIVHYWLHPENIATAPATLDLLRALLAEVAAARSAGRCIVLTQLGYCDWIKSLH